MRTKQEVFDFVATHLFTQGVQAMMVDAKKSRICKYRTDTGLSCAVGCLIPDEGYSVDLENKNISALAENQEFSKVREAVPELVTYEHMLRDLQSIHDSELGWQKTQWMRAALQRVAENHEVNPVIIDTLSFKDR